jgi:hypothetical protein
MATTPNGRSNGHIPHSPHRLGDAADLAFRQPPAGPAPPSRDYSGRRFVVIAIFVLAAIWAVLFIAFRQWRAQYFARAAYGARQVAPVIDGLAEFTPHGVARGDWKDAVDRTHALIVTVVDSNLLSIEQMNTLRDELAETVRRSRDRPDTAVDELGKVWDSLSARAAFLFRDTRATNGARHIRPALLPPPTTDRNQR